MLAAKAAKQDKHTERLVELDKHAGERETTNLLYVALTRARQCLFITGSQSTNRSGLGWYGMIREQLASEDLEEDQSPSLTQDFQKHSPPSMIQLKSAQATI